MVRYAVLYGVALTGLVFWFFQAPAVRFGYGFMGILICLLLAPFLLWLLGSIHQRGKLILFAVVAGLILYQGISLYSLVRSPALRATWLLPADYPKAQVAAQKLDGLNLFTPTHGDQCWYYAFPCVPNLGTGISLRGSSFASGFKISPPSPNLSMRSGQH